MDKTVTETPPRLAFSPYQKFVVAVLAFLQFTIILDFMIVSPLGAIVMPTLHITPRQFGFAVSSYAFAAAISGVLAAGFADRFDRKRLLLFFYAGFMVGTLLCGLATSYPALLIARIVTGFFGGVIGSVVLAIATDLFPLEMRGRVMGFIQSAFAASQVLGLPLALYLANHWDWHAPFLAIIAVAVPVGLVIALRMEPVVAHLKLRQEHSPFMHLVHTVAEPRYRLAFCLVLLLATGGYMLMPFATAYTVNNIGLPLTTLPTIYLVTGAFTVFMGPVAGKVSDSFGKFNTFCFGSVLAIGMVAIWTNLGRTALTTVIVINVLMYLGIFSRMVPAQALLSAVPEVTKRGAFNAINASLQQFSGGISAAIAGAVITEAPGGALQHFNWLGYVVMGVSLVAMTLMYFLHKSVPEHIR
ncbi:MAG TPA: MFS transporter [Rhizomicrobium sp.]|nr:MFS transporter [Rhizomicrobium sp.]